jgi:hypothetical protein
LYFSINDDDLINVREGMDSKDGKLWKNSMIEDMVALDKNKAWDVVEFLTRRKSIGKNGCSKRS